MLFTRSSPLVFALVLTSAGCPTPTPPVGPPSNPPGGDAGSSIVDQTGGVVVAPDEGVVVQVPAGAVSTPIEITFSPASGAPAGAVGPLVDIGPSGTTFADPVLVTILLDAAILDQYGAGIRLGTVVDGQWERLGGVVVDEATNSVSGVTTHFSVFGAYYEACDPSSISGCFEEHETCVVGLNRPGAPSHEPLCAVPCVTDGDCPDPLYCQRGACALKGCRTSDEESAGCMRAGHACIHTYGYSDAPAKYHNEICLPDCNAAVDDVCPSASHMQCVPGGCTYINSCTSPSGCATDETCFHGGVLRWGGVVGECLPCPLGCACGTDPGCPCAPGSSQQRCNEVCGDGEVEAPEQCDGSNLDGADCALQGYSWGELVCTVDCTFDESACVDECVNVDGAWSATTLPVDNSGNVSISQSNCSVEVDGGFFTYGTLTGSSFTTDPALCADTGDPLCCQIDFQENTAAGSCFRSYYACGHDYCDADWACHPTGYCGPSFTVTMERVVTCAGDGDCGAMQACIGGSCQG